MAASERSRSGSVSGRKERGRIDRPFDPAILKRAKEIVDRCQVVVRRESDGYFSRSLELPRALGDGVTPAASLDSTRESMAAVVTFMLECGETPPPASDETKLVQLNVRIAAGEKLMFEEAARAGLI